MYIIYVVVRVLESIPSGSIFTLLPGAAAYLLCLYYYAFSYSILYFNLHLNMQPKAEHEMHTLTERDRGLVPLLLRFSFLVLSNGGSSGQWRSVPSMECTAATHTPIMNTQDYWHDTWTRGHSVVSVHSLCVTSRNKNTRHPNSVQISAGGIF